MLDKPPDAQPEWYALTHLGSINELICKALGDGLDVPESSLTSPGAQQPDGLDKTGRVWPQRVPPARDLGPISANTSHSPTPCGSPYHIRERTGRLRKQGPAGKEP